MILNKNQTNNLIIQEDFVDYLFKNQIKRKY